MTLAGFLSFWTGLYFVAPGLDTETLVGTAVVLHICHAVVCRVVAGNNGYPRNVWTAVGFVGGLWAVTLLLLLPRRQSAPRP
jgi:hypothetical protein